MGRLAHRLADLACPLGRGGLHIEVNPLIDLRWSRPPDPPPQFSGRSPDRCEQGATSQSGTARTLSVIAICSLSNRMARDTGAFHTRSDEGRSMASFVKNLTFDCEDALRVARFWAAALVSDVD